MTLIHPREYIPCYLSWQEFDPEEFYHLLEAAEGQARQTISAAIPQYIIGKLGLDRDPLEALGSDVSSVDSGRPDTPETDSDVSHTQINLVYAIFAIVHMLIDLRKDPVWDS